MSTEVDDPMRVPTLAELEAAVATEEAAAAAFATTTQPDAVSFWETHFDVDRLVSLCELVRLRREDNEERGRIAAHRIDSEMSATNVTLYGVSIEKGAYGYWQRQQQHYAAEYIRMMLIESKASVFGPLVVTRAQRARCAQLGLEHERLLVDARLACWCHTRGRVFPRPRHPFFYEADEVVLSAQKMLDVRFRCELVASAIPELWRAMQRSSDDSNTFALASSAGEPPSGRLLAHVLERLGLQELSALRSALANLATPIERAVSERLDAWFRARSYYLASGLYALVARRCGGRDIANYLLLFLEGRDHRPVLPSSSSPPPPPFSTLTPPSSVTTTTTTDDPHRQQQQQHAASSNG